MYPRIKDWLVPEYFSYITEDASTMPKDHSASV